MGDFVFLDTETTGNDLLNDRLFQLCYKHNDILQSAYFAPPLAISIKSQSITHVTNKMVAGKGPFMESAMRREVDDLLKEKIAVAHNALFDVAMLAHEGVSVPKFICTLKVARALDPENEIPEYGLQFLRYYFELDVTADAHDAVGDVLVLEALFKRLYREMLQMYQDPRLVLEKMLAVSNRPILFALFPFGKHRGKKIDEVVLFDRPYVEWLLDQKTQNNRDDADWIFTLKYHLKIGE